VVVERGPDAFLPHPSLRSFLLPLPAVKISFLFLFHFDEEREAPGFFLFYFCPDWIPPGWTVLQGGSFDATFSGRINGRETPVA